MTASGFFKTSVFLSLTIGLPFCVFKGLFGLLLGGWAGALIVVWATLDFVMNTARAAMELGGVQRPPIEFCTLAQLGLALGRPSLMLAVDTFLSFAIICFVVWSGWIAELPTWGVYAWAGATTVNLMSLAVVNVWLELRREHERPTR